MKNHHHPHRPHRGGGAAKKSAAMGRNPAIIINIIIIINSIIIIIIIDINVNIRRASGLGRVREWVSVIWLYPPTPQRSLGVGNLLGQ